MTTTHNAEYVKTELLEMLAAAMDAGFAEYVGFNTRGGDLTAKTYDGEGKIVSRWKIDITATPIEGGEA